ncbi:NUDIX hydrolase [Mycobacterium sp. CBMA293]|uniref:NUDIX hydrolase n=1 Tax=unclassified Mycolicibacterium TaxID=2636767 RepID=UPI00135426E3|nr:MULTISPECIES: NUDIX hydrolase [unclassified Mycolicibacterium]MUL97390.1 NUDIX hydrolase [Mycolicibacterium sp. CBMA 230]MUL57794.1 NUDIX hydrolase [Mycolicibacterium sp. CBMA 335]MUL72757.1 NUDIX hydrolase [Mycolicibacterium sp. CBMA 311]MUM07224.1 NUDIX hydrolase [Mycolicibacterium sp. CBMA 213]MUM09520.1 NUDIX hydrolase [Mycolicibacterium sp. CBMA 293]
MPNKTAHDIRVTPVLAAGAVLWRPDASGTPLIAVVHRPRYDDWSLPKGKVDPGETEPVTAVREILEETGHESVLGRRLATVSYPLDHGTKKVRYWAARSTGGAFTPNSEVDELDWLPAADAMSRLQYPHDRKVLRRFIRRPSDTRTVLIVRHATAGRKARYKGDDQLRPLDKRGRAQAESLVGQLLAFGASDVYAASRTRCHQTVEPLAQELGVSVRDEPTLTEEAYATDPDAARKRVVKIAAKGDPDSVPVICTQGKVIPDLISWWSERSGVKPDKSRNRKGSMWVITLHGDSVIAADHLGSALPVKR